MMVVMVCLHGAKPPTRCAGDRRIFQRLDAAIPVRSLQVYRAAMSHRPFASISLLVLALTGCVGVKFNPSPLNVPLPDNFAKRSLWGDTGILQYRLDGLVGHVLVAEPDELFKRKQQILRDGYSLVQVAIDGGEVYQSKIDSRAAGGANAGIPLLGFAAKLGAEQTMEVVITDTSMVFIEPKDIPIEKLITEASKPNPDNLRRVWVQAVMLTQVVKRMHTKVDADTTVTGSTFGANGKVFNEAGVFQRDPKITMLLVDLEDLAQMTAAPMMLKGSKVPPLADTFASALSSVRVSTIIHIDPESLK